MEIVNYPCPDCNFVGQWEGGLSKHRRQHEAIPLKELTELFRQGKSATEIASRYRCSRRKISLTLQRAGLCRPNRTGRKFIPSGTRFGKLTVIDNDRRMSGKVACLVRCDCGEEKLLWNFNLRQGIVSCGCSMHSAKGDADWKRLRSHVLHKAKMRGFVFDLNLEQVKFLCQQPCYYCKEEPENAIRWRFKSRGGIVVQYKATKYSGLDRLDSSRGYVSGNVLPCCKFCNLAKRDYSIEYFTERLRRYGSKITADEVIKQADSLNRELEMLI